MRKVTAYRSACNTLFSDAIEALCDDIRYWGGQSKGNGERDISMTTAQKLVDNRHELRRIFDGVEFEIARENIEDVQDEGDPDWNEAMLELVSRFNTEKQAMIKSFLRLVPEEHREAFLKNIEGHR